MSKTLLSQSPTAHIHFMPLSYHHCHSRPWESKVLVYVNSTDTLYLSRMSALTHKKPRSILSLPLVRSEQDVYLAQRKVNGKGDKANKKVWAATLMVGKVKGYRVQRCLGKVKRLYVFEKPPL